MGQIPRSTERILVGIRNCSHLTTYMITEQLMVSNVWQWDTDTAFHRTYSCWNQELFPSHYPSHCSSCWLGTLVKKSLRLHRFTSDQDEGCYGCFSSKHALTEGVRFLMWRHAFKMSAMTSFHRKTSQGSNGLTHYASVMSLACCICEAQFLIHHTFADISGWVLRPVTQLINKHTNIQLCYLKAECIGWTR